MPDAEQLGRGRQRAAVGGGGQQRRSLGAGRHTRPCRRRPVHAVEALRAVEVREAGAADVGGRERVQLAVAREQQEVGVVRVTHPRIRLASDGDDDLTGRDAGEPGIGERAVGEPSEERGRDGDGFDHRLRKRGPSRFLERQQQRQLVEAETVGVLRHQESEDAEVGEGRPARGIVTGAVVPRGAHGGRRTRAFEDAAHAVAEAELLLVEREVHRL